jgi:hypothetical protein
VRQLWAWANISYDLEKNKIPNLKIHRINTVYQMACKYIIDHYVQRHGYLNTINNLHNDIILYITSSYYDDIKTVFVVDCKKSMIAFKDECIKYYKNKYQYTSKSKERIIARPLSCKRCRSPY